MLTKEQIQEVIDREFFSFSIISQRTEDVKTSLHLPPTETRMEYESRGWDHPRDLDLDKFRVVVD